MNIHGFKPIGFGGINGLLPLVHSTLVEINKDENSYSGRLHDHNLKHTGVLSTNLIST